MRVALLNALKKQAKEAVAAKALQAKKDKKSRKALSQNDDIKYGLARKAVSFA